MSGPAVPSGDGPSEGEAAVAVFDPAVAAHPHDAYRVLRDEYPVARFDLLDGMALVSRHEDVGWALRHPETFSSLSAIDIGQKRPLIPLEIDPPDHAKYRRLLDPHFTPRRVRLMEEDIRDLARSLLDRFAADGSCDFHTQFAVPLPCTIFLQLMGLPLTEVDLFLGWKDAIVRPAVDPSDQDAVASSRKSAASAIYDYFNDVIDERQREPREDLLTDFTVGEVEGRRLSREEILDTCILFLLGGLDTVTASLDCVVARLAVNPDERRQMSSDPETIPAAVEELLRWETPVMVVPRRVTSDVIVSGVELKAGEQVMLMLGAANCDEREYDDAERVDLQRTPNRHLAFSAGPHRCLGSHLARSELRIALEEFHRRIPDYTLAPGTELEFSTGIRQVSRLPLVFPRTAEASARPT